MLHYHGRPNVLVILTDQQRADAVGYANPKVHTPNIDALAAQGVTCPLAFVQSPQCQPSRASIFTGRYPTAHRLWWNGIDLARGERTLGNYLKNAGYHTGYFGKLHFDRGGNRAAAQHFGFDTAFLYEDWSKMFSMGFNVSGGRHPVEREFHAPMTAPTWTGKLTTPDLHHEEVITDRAISFVQETHRPYLCVVSYHGPHPPYAAPDMFSSLYRPDDMAVPAQKVKNQNGHVLSPREWQELKVQYYGAVSWIDACVGKLLSKVGYDTIVVFTSDHGDILGDHGLFSKGLFAYEGNVRVPLVLRIPGISGSYPHLVQSIDILPTILEACGVGISNPVQGKSLFRAVRTGEVVNGAVLSMIGYQHRLRMVRTPRHKYWLVGDEEYLFDLREDPGEEVNRSSHRDLAAHLRLLLLQGLIRAEDPLPQPA